MRGAAQPPRHSRDRCRAPGTAARASGSITNKVIYPGWGYPARRVLIAFARNLDNKAVGRVICIRTTQTTGTRLLSAPCVTDRLERNADIAATCLVRRDTFVPPDDLQNAYDGERSVKPFADFVGKAAVRDVDGERLNAP